MKPSLPTLREISKQIYLIRGHRVMLDSDLAQMYGTDTRTLNRAVRRNIERFPDGFMFQLDKTELENLMCQFGTSSAHHGGVNIEIVRAFVRLREILRSHRDLSVKLDQLERRYDAHFKVVFDAIRKLMAVGSPLRQRRIRTLGEK